MHLQLKNRDTTDVSDSIGLLISILVRYPEVGTLNYDPHRQYIKFTFIFSKTLAEEELQFFRNKLIQSIEAYNILEGKKPELIDINSQLHDNFTLIEVNRDINTLSHEEISLIISIVQQSFKQNLVCENNDYFLEEDLLMQEELIEHMLENIKTSTQEKNLIAFREEGRVLVFNK